MEKLKMFFKKEKKLGLILFVIFIFFIGATSFISSKTINDNRFLVLSSVIESIAYKDKNIDTSKDIVKDEIILGLPVKLEIPSLKINSTIEPLGLTKEGAMDSPVGPYNTGWYNLGPVPGKIGSSVIDGHAGFKGGIPAVFDDLYKIKIGDKVNILNDKGDTVVFVVRKISKYDPDADATKIFTSTDGKSHLNLITCTGTWDNVLKSHSSRLVVFTDKE